MLSRAPISRQGLLAVAVLAFASLRISPPLAQDATKPDLDVPYVHTPQAVVDRMLDMAKIQKDDFVIDLGSGDGRMPITAAQRHGARGLGVDLDPQRVSEALQNAKQAGVADRVDFRQGDLYETDLDRNVSVMTMYLLPRVNLDLRPRILNELRPGTRIVSHAFTMGDWEADERATVEGREIYFWVVPATVDGRWTMRDGADEIRLNLTQQFQKVQGTARLNGRYHNLQNPRLRGDRISFEIETRDGKTRRYVGRVEGGAIKAMPGGGGVEGWSAERLS